MPDLRAAFLGALRPDLSEKSVALLSQKIQMLHGGNAVRHLLEVASSTDSLVVGEREILRQLREAYERCRTNGLTGDHIRLAMNHTIETAKEVYSKTGIGEKALSVVSLAFGEMMRADLPTDARILLIGAGQTNELFAKFLAKKQFGRVTVFNRTLAKAEKIANSLGGKALPLDELAFFTEGFDAMIVCTGAQEAIITPDLYEKLLVGETDKKIVVDISLPNNVARQVVDAHNIQYVEIEG